MGNERVDQMKIDRNEIFCLTIFHGFAPIFLDSGPLDIYTTNMHKVSEEISELQNRNWNCKIGIAKTETKY